MAKSNFWYSIFPRICQFTCCVNSGSSNRSSHPEAFLEKGVLKIWSKFTGEDPCRSVKSHFGMGVLL